MAMNLSSGGGHRSRRSHRRAPMAEINVTPLVDVMLVLLIIFMVTAPLLVTGVPVELPESRANALDQKSEPVEIAIDRERRNLYRWHRSVAIRAARAPGGDCRRARPRRSTPDHAAR